MNRREEQGERSSLSNYFLNNKYSRKSFYGYGNKRLFSAISKTRKQTARSTAQEQQKDVLEKFILI